MVRQLFQNPHSFFSRKATENGFRREFGLLLAIGILGAAGQAWVSQLFLSELVNEPGLMRVNLIGKILAILAGPFVLWGLYAVSAHLVAHFSKSRGPIKRIFKVTAWSLVPVGVANAIYSVAIYWAFRDETIGDEVAGLNVSDQIVNLFELGNDDPIMYIAWIALAVAAVASGYLLAIGLQHARDLSADSAQKAAAVPVLIHLGFIVYSRISGGNCRRRSTTEFSCY